MTNLREAELIASNPEGTAWIYRLIPSLTIYHLTGSQVIPYVIINCPAWGAKYPQGYVRSFPVPELPRELITFQTQGLKNFRILPCPDMPDNPTRQQPWSTYKTAEEALNAIGYTSLSCTLSEPIQYGIYDEVLL